MKKKTEKKIKAEENQAVLEEIVRQHMSKYKTKILNKPLIAQIKKEVAQIFLNIPVSAKTKKEMLNSVESSLLEKHEEIVKIVQNYIDTKRAQEKESK